MNGVALNYMALYVSILAKVPPEGAFYRLGEYHQLSEKEPGVLGRPRVCSDADVASMVELQNAGWSLSEISEAYGMSPAHSCRRMSEWRKANGQQTRSPNRNPGKANNKKK